MSVSYLKNASLSRLKRERLRVFFENGKRYQSFSAEGGSVEVLKKEWDHEKNTMLFPDRVSAGFDIPD